MANPEDRYDAPDAEGMATRSNPIDRIEIHALLL
jgi:hypothetical protein